MPANTDWFRAAHWGVFNHYLAYGASHQGGVGVTPEAWNRRVDSFDVPGLVRQLQAVGARYYFITLGQNYGFYCSPNATYEELVRQTPSRLAKRDLVGELADALDAVGIRLMAYLPSHAPAMNREAVQALSCTPPWDASKWQLRPGSYLRTTEIDQRLSVFQRHWEAIVREWSLRWGRKVHGWWIDGAYYADLMYRNPDEPNFASFAAALKAGNPDSIVAFNPGVKVPVIRYTEHEDYTAGEVADALPVGRWGKDGFGRSEGTVNGAQYHLLTFMGEYWGRGLPRFSTEMVIGYTQFVNDCGGVISWDVPVSDDGRIPEAFLERLAALNQAIG